MDRKRAILRMARIMMIGFGILIVALVLEIFYFDNAHGLYPIIGALVYVYLFGLYIRKKHSGIERDYPKAEDRG